MYTATASASYAESSNHLASSGLATFTVDKAPTMTTVTCSAGPFTYTGLTQTPCSGSVSGANLSQALTVTYANNINAGTANASTSYAESANHLASSDSKTFTIVKAHLTVTAANKTKIYDGAPFTAYSAIYTGFVNSESPAVVGGTPAFSTTPVTPAVNPGTYGILVTQGSLTAANYAFTSFVSGTLTIGYGTCAAGYGPGGVILQPINSDGTSVYNRKGGSTIPVKFTVCDAAGTPIANPAAVFAGTGGTLTMLSAVRGTVDVVNEPSVSEIPDAAFRWAGDKWIFNMATTNLQAGTIYTFRINLSLGTITFRVGVK